MENIEITGPRQLSARPVEPVDHVDYTAFPPRDIAPDGDHRTAMSHVLAGMTGWNRLEEEPCAIAAATATG